MSRHRGALSLALLLGSVNAACVNFRPPPAPIAATVAGDAPTPVWTARAGRRLSGQVEMRDNTLYGGGTDRKVYAVDLASGEVRWSMRLSGMVVGGVLLSGDTIYAASSRPEGRVYALHRSNGKQIWRTSTHPIGAPLALVDGVLVAETQRGGVLAINPATGKVLWHRRLGGVARVGAAPAGKGGVLVATTDSLFRLALADGRVTHRAASPGTFVSPWLSHKGALIGGTTDSLVVSISPSDLGRNWTLQVDAPVLSSPAAMGDTLFLASRIGTVYRIDPDSAAAERVAVLDWPVTAPVAIVRSEILLGGADGMIRALRPDGSEIWRVRVWRPVEFSPIPLADGLLAIGGNGDLHRYRR